MQNLFTPIYIYIYIYIYKERKKERKRGVKEWILFGMYGMFWKRLKSFPNLIILIQMILNFNKKQFKIMFNG